MMMNFLPLKFLLLAVFVNATLVTCTVVHSNISCQSEEFHAYLTCQRRQSLCPPNMWYNNRATCASVNSTQYDPGLLADLQYQGLYVEVVGCLPQQAHSQTIVTLQPIELLQIYFLSI